MAAVAISADGADRPATTRATTSPTVELQRDVVYGKSAGQELKLDLARPAQRDAKLPCILFVHGGGWQHGDKSALDDLIKWTAMQGYVAAAINYRMAPDFVFPAQVNDAKCAVRFMRSHADEFGIDPARIGAFGDSAGGHLVMMLAVTRRQDDLEGNGGWPETSSEVAAVVSWYGPTDLSAADIPAISKPVVKTFLGSSAEESPELARKASPITYVQKGQPPILLLQGTTDAIVPFTQAVSMAKRMSDVGVPGRAELLIGAGHGFAGDDHHHAMIVTVEFFNEHLRDLKVPK